MPGRVSPGRRPARSGNAPGARSHLHGSPLRERKTKLRRAGDPRKRSIALLVVVLTALGAIGARTGYLQVVASDEYVAAAREQRLAPIALPADRGSIFDRNGDELAMSVPSMTVWADPLSVAHAAEAAALLAPVLEVDAARLEELLRSKGRFVYLKRQLAPEMGARVSALFDEVSLDAEGRTLRDHPLLGVHLRDEPTRVRPAGDLARSLLGGVDPDGNGYSGLEAQYENPLLGKPGTLLIERDLSGNTIAAGEQSLDPAVRGDDLVLTIDRSLQFEVERALGDAIASSQAKGAMAVVSNPRTGEILAMANMTAGKDGGPAVPSSSNAALVSTFEPGSVNKIVTMAAAIEEGVYAPTDVLVVPDSLDVSVKTYKDHDPHEPMSWTLADILAQSSNVGTIMVAQALGPTRIDAYLRKFGLSSFTGLNFPKESRGSMLDLSEWTGTSIGSIPIGQGVAVNAMQMLGAFNIIANNGVSIPPRLVRATVSGNGSETPVAPGESREVISPSTAREITRMLVRAVDQGTGGKARVDRYTVAGKTGTARKPSLTSRGYVDGAYMASFAGFLPAEDPQLSAIVVMDEPVAGYYGGQVAAPVFARISQYALRVLRIPPPPVPAGAPR